MCGDMRLPWTMRSVWSQRNRRAQLETAAVVGDKVGEVSAAAAVGRRPYCGAGAGWVPMRTGLVGTFATATHPAQQSLIDSRAECS